MDTNLLKNLNLDSTLNPNDLKLLNQILTSIGSNGNKLPKISAKERNNLINNLSSISTLDQIPKKDIKNINENEKKIYREELNKKLKNKLNEKKMQRSSNLIKKNSLPTTNYSGTINKINDILNDVNLNQLPIEIPNNIQNDIPNNIQNDIPNNIPNDIPINSSNTLDNDLKQNLSNSLNLTNLTNTKQEIIINNIINIKQNNDLTNQSDLYENLDDFLNLNN